MIWNILIWNIDDIYTYINMRTMRVRFLQILYESMIINGALNRENIRVRFRQSTQFKSNKVN